jgi:glycosyltransferase involved in cell wall biosynthesis
LRSGIGDYTRHLLPYLRARAEVEVFVDQGLSAKGEDSDVTREVDSLRPREFDQILYQIGNERQHAFMLPMLKSLGGTVMLHDWVLFDLALAAHPQLERGGLRGFYSAWTLGGLQQARIWAGGQRAPTSEASDDCASGLGPGWHAPEQGGRWTAPVALVYPGELRPGKTRRLRLTVGACAGASFRISQAGRALYRGEGPGELECELSAAGPVRLEVRAARPTEEQRANGDPRVLGLFVEDLALANSGGAWQSLDLDAPVGRTWGGLSERRFSLSLNRAVVRHGDAFLVHSDWLAGRVLESRNQATPIARVHHGVERRWSDDERCAARPSGRREAFVIASLGAMQSHKRIEVVLRALAHARRSRPDLQLVCAGEARPQEVDHGALVRELGLEGAVHVTGWLSEEQIWRELHSADLCVNLRGPSAGGTSGGICQALSLGRAVITNDLPELAHLPRECVLRIPSGEGEVEALSRVFLDLAGDPVRRATLEASARHAVDTELHWEHVADRYIEALESFPEARAARRSLIVRFHHATRQAGIKPPPERRVQGEAAQPDSHRS